jgi:hypothetical protein
MEAEWQRWQIEPIVNAGSLAASLGQRIIRSRQSGISKPRKGDKMDIRDNYPDLAELADDAAFIEDDSFDDVTVSPADLAWLDSQRAS